MQSSSVDCCAICALKECNIPEKWAFLLESPTGASAESAAGQTGTFPQLVQSCDRDSNSPDSQIFSFVSFHPREPSHHSHSCQERETLLGLSSGRQWYSAGQNSSPELSMILMQTPDGLALLPNSNGQLSQLFPPGNPNYTFSNWEFIAYFLCFHHA